ncbi:MAG: hypothetical protein OXH66_04980 [Gemmatimonadetes bacterium]|nr:hypothetical protein [Gemmatimonadota bacterium]MDE2678724.1 hypothetical protein [Gemmatimonadota bacterium]
MSDREQIQELKDEVARLSGELDARRDIRIIQRVENHPPSTPQNPGTDTKTVLAAMAVVLIPVILFFAWCANAWNESVESVERRRAIQAERVQSQPAFEVETGQPCSWRNTTLEKSAGVWRIYRTDQRAMRQVPLMHMGGPVMSAIIETANRYEEATGVDSLSVARLLQWNGECGQ